jgi:Protein of unknown function (DUF2695)
MSDKDYKKRLKTEFKSREKQTLESEMRLTKEHLLALFNHLDNVSCDHTLSHTKEFLVSIKADPEVVIPWLERHGGYCDCEVLANVESAYEGILNK